MPAINSAIKNTVNSMIQEADSQATRAESSSMAAAAHDMIVQSAQTSLNIANSTLSRAEGSLASNQAKLSPPPTKDVTEQQGSGKNMSMVTKTVVDQNEVRKIEGDIAEDQRKIASAESEILSAGNRLEDAQSSKDEELSISNHARSAYEALLTDISGLEARSKSGDKVTEGDLNKLAKQWKQFKNQFGGEKFTSKDMGKISNGMKKLYQATYGESYKADKQSMSENFINMRENAADASTSSAIDLTPGSSTGLATEIKTPDAGQQVK